MRIGYRLGLVSREGEADEREVGVARVHLNVAVPEFAHGVEGDRVASDGKANGGPGDNEGERRLIL